MAIYYDVLLYTIVYGTYTHAYNSNSVSNMQVLSESVSKALELYRVKDSNTLGNNSTQATEEFVMLMDNFFDAFNTQNLTAGKRKRKTMRHPYWKWNDW